MTALFINWSTGWDNRNQCLALCVFYSVLDALNYRINSITPANKAVSGLLKSIQAH